LWEIDELEAFDKHKRFHEDSLIYIEKLTNGSLADKPKRPKVKFTIIATMMEMVLLKRILKI